MLVFESNWDSILVTRYGRIENPVFIKQNRKPTLGV
jgi:hypothetical protein